MPTSRNSLEAETCSLFRISIDATLRENAMDFTSKYFWHCSCIWIVLLIFLEIAHTNAWDFSDQEIKCPLEPFPSYFFDRPTTINERTKDGDKREYLPTFLYFWGRSFCTFRLWTNVVLYDDLYKLAITLWGTSNVVWWGSDPKGLKWSSLNLIRTNKISNVEQLLWFFIYGKRQF